MRIAIISVLIRIALAGPVATTSFITANDILSIDSSTASCVSAPAVSECRTASQAAPYVAASFTMFHIYDFATQAALLSLMLYESGSFKYSQNHYPGVPGQGTRNMQSPAYNKEYAQLLVNVKNSGVSSSALTTAQGQGAAAVLALVNVDLWSFSSAAWFYVVHCSDGIKAELAKGTLDGWTAYLTQCVGTTVTEDRTQIWNKAMALGKWSG